MCTRIVRQHHEWILQSERDPVDPGAWIREQRDAHEAERSQQLAEQAAQIEAAFNKHNRKRSFQP